MVIMERSRSPRRSSPTSDGTRPLVNFPVGTTSLGSGTTPCGKGHQAGHPMGSQWNQGNQAVQATQELPYSQDSLQIPPGQVGASQHSFGMSQASMVPAPMWYSPPIPTPVTPRPRVQALVWLV